MAAVDRRLLHDDDETSASYGDVDIPVIKRGDDVSGAKSGDVDVPVMSGSVSGENSGESLDDVSDEEDDDEVSDCESVVTGNRVESVKAVNLVKSVNGLVKVGEDEKMYEMIVNKFVTKLGEFGIKVGVESVYRKTFTGSVISEAKMNSFRIYAKAVERKNGGNANIKYGWFGGCSKEEIGRILGFGFGGENVGKTSGFGNCVVLNADYSPLESVESAIADGDGVKHILLCRVILGKTEMVDPFSTQCHPSSDDYDSGVDDLASPRKFIVWSSQMNTHILPEFVISFKAQRIVNRPQVDGVRLQKPVSPWIPIPELINNLSKMLPPKLIKEVSQYRRRYIERKISRSDMIQGIRKVTGDEMLLKVLKDFTEQRRDNRFGRITNQFK